MKAIYSIRHIDSNKVYIGSATDLRTRWAVHKHHLRNNTHHNRYLQAAWNLYKEESFLFEVLEEVEDKKDLILKEQLWLDKIYNKVLNNKIGFNLCLIAGNTLGFKHSESTKEALSNIKRRLPDDTENIICSRYLQGESTTQLAKEFNFCLRGVYRLLERRNVKMRNPGQQQGKPSNGRKENREMKKLRLQKVA